MLIAIFHTLVSGYRPWLFAVMRKRPHFPLSISSLWIRVLSPNYRGCVRSSQQTEIKLKIHDYFQTHNLKWCEFTNKLFCIDKESSAVFSVVGSSASLHHVPASHTEIVHMSDYWVSYLKRLMWAELSPDDCLLYPKSHYHWWQAHIVQCN